MSSIDRVYIVASMGTGGADVLKRNGVMKAICKTPRGAVTAFNPALKRVSIKVAETEKEGVTVFSTGSRGDIVVIDLLLLHSARCLTRD